MTAGGRDGALHGRQWSEHSGTVLSQVAEQELPLGPDGGSAKANPLVGQCLLAVPPNFILSSDAVSRGLWYLALVFHWSTSDLCLGLE